jgi:hypothetical protein
MQTYIDTYPVLPEDHIRREACKAFAGGVEDLAIRIRLLLGEEKMVYKALRQALKLQAVLLAARPKKQAPGYLEGADCKETKDDWHGKQDEDLQKSWVC